MVKTINLFNMAYQGQNVFLGNQLIGRSYLGTKEVSYSPSNVSTGPSYIIRPDTYSSFIAYAQPMNYFSGSFSMTSFDSDIHAAIKGSGTNYRFAPTGSGTYQANGSKTAFSSDGYNTSLKIAGVQNAGGFGPTTVPTDLVMGTSDFVWEAYVNTDASIGQDGIAMLLAYSTTGNWTFSQTPSYIRYLVGPSDLYNDSATNLPKTADVWRHWAFVRSGSNFYCYWNGTKVATMSGSPTINTNDPVRLLGSDSGYGGALQIAQYQDFRIYKGTDKGYTGSTITPPLSIVTLG